MSSEVQEDMLDEWDKKIHADRHSLKYSGCYYNFSDASGVLSEGSDDLDGSAADIEGNTPCILTSCSKVFSGTAVMRTMHLRPEDWYPLKAMHEFKGWETWKDFPVEDHISVDAVTDHSIKHYSDDDGKHGWSERYADKVTVHNLLTHTSGWPFGLRGTRYRILNMPLYFGPDDPEAPDAKRESFFGYSIGHRILGWMLVDYWRDQADQAKQLGFPEMPSKNEQEDILDGKLTADIVAKYHNFATLNDVFRFLVYDPLGISEETKFIEDKFKLPHSIMGEFFDMKFFDQPNTMVDGNDEYLSDDDPADLALQATGRDMMKLGMMALRRGKLENGKVFIEKWDEWAATNKLQGGKLSKALSHWKMESSFDDTNFLLRTLVTRTVNAGPFGWSYFGATYHDVGVNDPNTFDGDAGPVVAVGWKGFSSSGLRADYKQDVAFTMMQECVPDGGSRNFSECVHNGKVGKYNLGDVGRLLAQMEPEEVKKKRDNYKKQAGCCFSVMTETRNPSGWLSCVQGLVRCAYWCILPVGVRALDFHQNEHLGDEKHLREKKLLPTKTGRKLSGTGE